MKRQNPDPNLVLRIQNCLKMLRERRVKKSREYIELKAMLVPLGYKPFDIFATYNYIAGNTKGDWEASIKLASYVAQRKKVS
jgi:hypothetical protein